MAQMAVNYLGHFMLTHLLIPCLSRATEQGESSRVVNVSSCTHTIGQIRYDDFNYRNYYRAGMAYADSKLAQVMFALELQRVFDKQEVNIKSHAVHPGELQVINSSKLIARLQRFRHYSSPKSFNLISLSSR